jgi:hypothetical protein
MGAGEDLMRVVNDWLGWGDPQLGLWFIGVEEGTTFTAAKIGAMRGRTYQPVENVRKRNSPVAIRTASVVCRLNGHPDAATYRNTRMGWSGSRVFNGNVYPLGRPSVVCWPDSYVDLLGVTHADYVMRAESLLKKRRTRFQALRRSCRPQAIVCFGKSCWREFEDIFVTPGSSPRQSNGDFNFVVYDADRVILTPHFSRGVLMPNKAVDCLATILKCWRVDLPQ